MLRPIICGQFSSRAVDAITSNPTASGRAAQDGLETETSIREPEPGIALCLSGGGYRAMVFHLGTLWRMNELGLLRKLARVSSVSGGSITAGLLGQCWTQLGFGADGVAANLRSLVIDPILSLAGRTIDRTAILAGILLPGTVGAWIARALRRHLYGDATLQALPTDMEGPRFVLNATSLQTGALWRFSRPYMGDPQVERLLAPQLALARAVAASAAFPPVLSPVVIRLDPAQFTLDPEAPLRKEPFTGEAVLTDGGVYDNLGLETAWKRYRTVLISDGGAKIAPQGKPAYHWAGLVYRVNEIIDNQVRSLRKRQVMDAYRNPDDAHDGAYWGIRTRLAEYGLPDALPCPEARTADLAAISTRLKRLEPALLHRLVNWGYAVCDAALHRYCSDRLPNPPAPAFPFPGGV